MIVTIAVGLAGVGTALAMTSDTATGTTSESSTASEDIRRPLPLPTESPIRETVKNVLTADGGGSGSGSGGDGEAPAEESPDGQADGKGGGKAKNKPGKDQSSSGSAAPFGWAPVYGGWQRFFGTGGQFGSQSSFGYYTETQTVPAPSTASVAASAGAVTIAPVATTLPQNPAYLWLLLPVGFLLLVASAYAVFEPVRRPGRLAVLVSSARASARAVPAGMTRTAARGLLRAVRVFGGWAGR
jgi:hypothetical protein